MLRKFLDIVGIDVLPPRGIVHVGAHIGQEILEYKDYDPEVLVWVEADPVTYDSLKKNMSENWGLSTSKHWCIRALVSDKDDEMLDFHIAKNSSESSSMFEFTETHIKQYPQAAPTGEVLNLPTKTLSTILGGLDLSPSQIDYLILDTQGAEMKCLGGLGDFIENLRFITTEVSTENFYAGGAQLHEIDSYLGVRGFLRVTPDPGYGHGDALYLRINPEFCLAAELDDSLRQRDRLLREIANDFIVRINNDWELLDMAAIEKELFVLFEEYEDVLVLPSSRDICTMITRFAYGEGMAKVFSAFIRPLGWI